ncbi:MAG: hypothetical protein HKO65_14370 [Gemmatimonadetes bacterium]|nr:hypothetical protein [Gemmatimonadota bacterium]NNM06272.1 hypothetical protein [Gemmatimonadota bacterium]
MNEESKTEDGTLLRRVPVIVRSWDGPNSRVGLEMDLGQMPWGPFDALGKRLSILLPATDEAPEGVGSESQVERALRHVEHAADRCAEFAQLANGNQELWRRSHETWEWIRKYLTSLWVETEVDGQAPAPLLPGSSQGIKEQPGSPEQDPSLPGALPGAAATLRVAARALRATPLSSWRESTGSGDAADPTREEAVQTLLGLARILGGSSDKGDGSGMEAPDPGTPESVPGEPAAAPDTPVEDGADPDKVSFDYASGYDEGYQMGRRVGLALGAKKRSQSDPRGD